MVHGWMDVAASCQFVVDAFARDHYVIAPDWRGYGLTEAPAVPTTTGSPTTWPTSTSCSTTIRPRTAGRPGRPQHGRQRGHAVCGRAAASASAGWSTWKASAWRPRSPAQAPAPLREVDGRAQGIPPRRDRRCKPTTRVDGVARRLMKTNTRLTQDKADWLAGTGPGQSADGSGASWATRRTRSSTPSLYRVDEVLEIYRAITRAHCWPWKPATTAWRSGGRASTRWRSTTNGCSSCRVRIGRDRRTPATCCTTTSPSELARLIEDFPRNSRLDAAASRKIPLGIGRAGNLQHVTALEVGRVLPHTPVTNCRGVECVGMLGTVSGGLARPVPPWRTSSSRAWRRCGKCCGTRAARPPASCAGKTTSACASPA